MKTLEAEKDRIYHISEKTMTDYESGAIVFKNGGQKLNLSVCGRTGNGFNIIFS